MPTFLHVHETGLEAVGERSVSATSMTFSCGQRPKRSLVLLNRVYEHHLDLGQSIGQRLQVLPTSGSRHAKQIFDGCGSGTHTPVFVTSHVLIGAEVLELWQNIRLSHCR